MTESFFDKPILNKQVEVLDLAQLAFQLAVPQFVRNLGRQPSTSRCAAPSEQAAERAHVRVMDIHERFLVWLVSTPP
jgi:hypothetical protein